MAAQKRRVVIRQAEDMGPTPERMAKGDFETVERDGKKIRRKSDTLAALLSSGRIEQQHVNAANRWYRDWVLETVGYFESAEMRDAWLHDEDEVDRLARREAERAAGFSHDNISWGIMRGRAACRLSIVRHHIFSVGERILQFIVADGVTFCEFAKMTQPNASQAYNEARNVKAQAAFVLHQLEELYRPSNKHLFATCYPNEIESCQARRVRITETA